MTPAATPLEQASFLPVRSTRTFEAAIANILDGVERGRLRRGDRLPPEPELAGELGISVPTLRQALVVLSRAGVLEMRPGKAGGIFLVSDLIPTEAITHAVAFEEHAAIDTLRARRVIEPAVVVHASRVATADDYAELERTTDLLRSHLGDRPLVMRADAMFHRALVRACHNQTLQETLQVVARGLAPIRDAYGGGLDADRQTLDVHTRQVAAMQARDEEALLDVVDEHLRMLEAPFAKAIGGTWRALFGRR
jgi:GntR family transcriptional regulator, transcriptional repressor for pyruvate dehydrogenase complex